MKVVIAAIVLSLFTGRIHIGMISLQGFFIGLDCQDLYTVIFGCFPEIY